MLTYISPPDLYTLSLHDALPIYAGDDGRGDRADRDGEERLLEPGVAARGEADHGDAGDGRDTHGCADLVKGAQQPRGDARLLWGDLAESGHRSDDEQHADAKGSEADPDGRSEGGGPQGGNEQTDGADDHPDRAEPARAELADELSCHLGAGHRRQSDGQEQQSRDQRAVSGVLLEVEGAEEEHRN